MHTLRAHALTHTNICTWEQDHSTPSAYPSPAQTYFGAQHTFVCSHSHKVHSDSKQRLSNMHRKARNPASTCAVAPPPAPPASPSPAQACQGPPAPRTSPSPSSSRKDRYRHASSVCCFCVARWVVFIPASRPHSRRSSNSGGARWSAISEHLVVKPDVNFGIQSVRVGLAAWL
jgi:hypothetical protein